MKHEACGSRRVMLFGLVASVATLLCAPVKRLARRRRRRIRRLEREALYRRHDLLG